MRKKSIPTFIGSAYERYFENGSPNPAGDLLGAGIGLPTHRNDWWDVREMWTYPYYNLNMILGDGIGSYRNENGFPRSVERGFNHLTGSHSRHRLLPL